MQKVALVLGLALAAYGQQCNFASGDYTLKWWRQGNEIVFDLEYKNFGMLGWTGVGFGGAHMQNVDWIEVGVRGGRVQVDDRWLTGFSYGRSDQQQGGANNARLIFGSVSNGLLRAQFARPIFASDSTDADLNRCIKWVFVTKKGAAIGRIHSGKPVHSRAAICAAQCTQQMANTVPAVNTGTYGIGFSTENSSEENV